MKFNQRRILCWLFAAVFVTTVTVSQAQSKKTKAAAIRYAKRYLVSRIEKGLPSKPFGVWFQELVGQETPVEWEINDCGKQSGTSADRGRNFPMCVKATAKQSADFVVSVNIQYGTFKRGITRDRAVVRFIGTGAEDAADYTEDLKELRRRLRQRAIDAEFFNPFSGVFVISGENKPPGFEDFSEMYIETNDLDHENEFVAVTPNGLIEVGEQRFAMQKIVFDGKRWSFETVSIGGVSYQFDGKFSKITLDEHGNQGWKDVLQGHLIKFIVGSKTAEADLVFSFLFQGE